MNEADTLACQYRGIAVKEARKIASRVGFEYTDDLISEAWIGVLLAARDHDITKGPFEPHATVYAGQHALAYAKRYILTRGISGICLKIRYSRILPLERHTINKLYPQKNRNIFELPVNFWIRVTEVLSGKVLHAVLQYYQHNRTLEDIGAELGVTKEYIRILRNRGLSKLNRLFPNWFELLT